MTRLDIAGVALAVLIAYVIGGALMIIEASKRVLGLRPFGR